MNLLALEAATECCSVALSVNGELIVRSEYAPRRHAELLLPMCDAVLAEAGISRRQLDAIAVGRGPGAFTGVRLAISAAQGMALALDLPVIPVSSLAALALDAPHDRHPILTVIDARMGEIYVGLFGRSSDGLVAAIGAETVGPADTLVLPQSGPWHVIGSGWDSYRETLLRSRLKASAFRRPQVWSALPPVNWPPAKASQPNSRCRPICATRWRSRRVSAPRQNIPSLDLRGG